MLSRGEISSAQGRARTLDSQDREDVKTHVVRSQIDTVALSRAVSVRVTSVNDASRSTLGALLAAAASSLADPDVVGQLAEGAILAVEMALVRRASSARRASRSVDGGGLFHLA